MIYDIKKAPNRQPDYEYQLQNINGFTNFSNVFWFKEMKVAIGGDVWFLGKSIVDLTFVEENGKRILAKETAPSLTYTFNSTIQEAYWKWFNEHANKILLED